MKKAFTMALTAAMVLVMGVTAFALPDAVEPDNVGILDTIITDLINRGRKYLPQGC